jgi:catechol 2,3-dioxygenase-like lactoylglutathione lyase family enzyme
VANQSGRPIAPARRLMAAVLGTIGVFVMLFGLGLSSWSIVALGVAMLALAVALAMVNVVRRGARAWVTGTVQVKAVSPPPASSVYGRAELAVVVTAPGLPIQEVTIRDPRVPVDKWPVPGDTLPVTVDVDDMRRVRITWDQVPPRTDAGDLNQPLPYDSTDDFVDDLLGDPEPPPWATRDRQWGLGPDEPPAPTPPAPRLGEDMDQRAASPIVVREAPGGPILEGEVVEHDDLARPLPHRSPPPPASGYRPSPRPRTPAATVTADPDARPGSGTPEASPEAPPAPPQAAGAPAPGQRLPQESRPHAVPPDHRPAEAGPNQDDADTRPTRSAAGSADAAPTGSASAPDPSRTAAAVTTTPDQADATATDQADATAIDQERVGDPATTPGRPPADARAVGPDHQTPPTAAPPAADSALSDRDPEIDLPLDGDPEPAPEVTAPAQPAVAAGLIAQPAGTAPTAGTALSTDTAQPANAAEPADTAPPAAGEPGRGSAAPTDAAAQTHAVDNAKTDTADPASSMGRGPATGHERGPWAALEGGFEPDDRAHEVITAYPSARPGPAGAIHGVGITVLVTDLERSIAFYRDVLGFFEIDSGTAGAVLASGDTRVVLRRVHDLAAGAGRLIYLNLEVGDVEAIYEELRSKGVRFLHGPQPVNRGDKLELWAASFNDPDGHNIAITQWRAIR